DAEARGAGLRPAALSRRDRPAHLRERLSRGVGALVAAPDHADQRVPPDTHRAQGPQVPRGGDGEVLLRQRLEQARGLQSPRQRGMTSDMSATTPASLHPRLREVTDRIRARSSGPRAAYLERMAAQAGRDPARKRLSCTNLAHGFAASADPDKQALKELRWPNLAIISAYNDMLSAHQPYERFPGLIRAAAREAGATAQVAGGVPAMCDGVTQGQAGMELSLFSRDVIAMSTGIALSHGMFDAALCLGVCDKIVPGLLIGALSFGQLPAVFVPAGPMPSGLPNKEKARIRQLFAEGRVGRDALLESEAGSYHSAGTCTFYGTANSNQMLMEVMGLHLPGSAFVSPNTELRDALTAAATRRAAQITALGQQYLPLAKVLDEASIVNAIVGLLATGGSTNHTLHLIAIARAAGILIDW